MVKPVGRPNKLYQVVLGYLVANVNPDRGLARNVSWLNVERAAKRWVP